MSIRRLGALLMVAGALALLVGLGGTAKGSGIAVAQSLPERPTLTPAPPSQGGGSDDNDEGEAPGRITGTVIDLASGAPAPGVEVLVGDTTVTTDANGNYDRNGLAAGTYVVSMRAPSGRGDPAQAPVSVELAAGETEIVHLAFGARPTPAAAQEKPPAALPNTSGEDAPSLTVVLGLAMLLGGAGLRVAGRRA
jgi:LPXTG-motif cell wall-anchored protein